MIDYSAVRKDVRTTLRSPGSATGFLTYGRINDPVGPTFLSGICNMADRNVGPTKGRWVGRKRRDRHGSDVKAMGTTGDCVRMGKILRGGFALRGADKDVGFIISPDGFIRDPACMASSIFGSSRVRLRRSGEDIGFLDPLRRFRNPTYMTRRI